MSILRVDSIQLNATGNAGLSISNTWNVSISAGSLEGLIVQSNGDVTVNNRLIVKSSGTNYVVNTAIELALSTANTALSVASNSGATIAIAAFDQANIASASNPVAQSAYGQANAAYAQANLGGNKLGTTGFFNFNDVELGENVNILSKNFTISIISANNGSGNITANAHTFVVNDVVQFTSTGGTPANVNTNANYYIVTTTANVIQVSSTRAGNRMNLQNIGSGTITIYKPVNASAVGPVSLANGFTINVATGSTLAVL